MANSRHCDRSQFVNLAASAALPRTAASPIPFLPSRETVLMPIPQPAFCRWVEPLGHDSHCLMGSIARAHRFSGKINDRADSNQ
jgi:hypothetical protein